jgi:RHH-type proline utilization regulon transcriptional repressor/proline dehydrogenase/delta 1-pyrroline-5-carboxylate dehydrogenase
MEKFGSVERKIIVRERRRDLLARLEVGDYSWDMKGAVAIKEIEKEVLSLGTEIFNEAQAASASIFHSDFYTGKLIEWAMDDEEFRVSLFRFVDVLPSLTSAAEIIRHVQEHFQPVAHRIPGLVKWGLNIDPDSLAAKATAAIVKNQVRSMAERFILGEDPNSALKSLRAIRKNGMAFTVDLLGEAVVSEAEAEQYGRRYLELIQTLHKEVPGWKESAPLVAGHPGEATALNISVKLTALYSQAHAVSFEKTVAVLADRLAAILREARRCGCFVYVDMEHTQFTDITIETCKRVFGSDEFRDYDRVGMVFQSYLRRTDQDVAAIIEWLRKRGAPMAIRLVKGAYWDTETIQAKLLGWPVPVWQEKVASDVQFEKLARLLLENHPLVLPAFGSHNIRSLCYALKYAESIGLDKTAYEIQMLYGMADPIKKPFVSRGYLVREYAPIGELIPGMGYLVRRLLENTSNKGFIRLGFHAHEKPDQLLKRPEIEKRDTGTEHLAMNPRKEFHNCPLLDFSLQENRRAIQGALDRLLAALRKEPPAVQPIVAGKNLSCEKTMDSIAPHDTGIVVGRVGMASIEQTEQTLQALRGYFPTWRDTPVENRAEVLFKTAEVLNRRRPELVALIILETGKPWTEADADVCEAMDFLNYYALQARSLFQPRKMGNLAGEDNLYFYEPRGVCAVISPWNFPSSIPCGMFSAALVTGNCAVLKPAKQSPVIAYELFRAFQEAGLPAGAAAFLPGYGEEMGPALVNSPKVSTIVFTGSKAVGLKIVRDASVVQPGQEHVKRVIAEMGSKNGIIVDTDADLDEAVKGVVYSAFGYAGQKCSACSRVVVLEPVYEKFLSRLTEATRSIPVGAPTDPATVVGPVIDSDAHKRLLGTIEDAKRDSRLVAQGELPAGHEKGYYVPPTVFADVPAGHALLKKELFGPVLAVIKVKDFDSALREALNTEYGLTGGVYSRSPENLKRAAREFRVGNLYLNRGCTGALVHRQPFGGAKMSGVGSKAGGPDYLLQFVVPRTVTESTIRKGFAPMAE